MLNIIIRWSSYNIGMRVAGVTIPDTKRLEVGLTALFGVGRPRAKKILTAARVEYGKHAKDLTADEEARVRREVEKFTIEGELKRQVSGNIKRLKDTKSHRGIRHMRGLSVRGQRTKTNSRTRRGNVRKTMGSGKRKLEKK